MKNELITKTRAQRVQYIKKKIDQMDDNILGSYIYDLLSLKQHGRLDQSINALQQLDYYILKSIPTLLLLEKTKDQMKNNKIDIFVTLCQKIIQSRIPKKNPKKVAAPKHLQTAQVRSLSQKISQLKSFLKARKQDKEPIRTVPIRDKRQNKVYQLTIVHQDQQKEQIFKATNQIQTSVKIKSSAQKSLKTEDIQFSNQIKLEKKQEKNTSYKLNNKTHKKQESLINFAFNKVISAFRNRKQELGIRK